MKKTITLLSIFSFFITSFVCANEFAFPIQKAQQPTKSKTDTIYRNITVVQADSLIQANTGNPDFIILDVRTLSEFNNGYIQGAINLDYYSPNFSSLLDALDHNKRYLVYCGSGMRSAKVFDSMQVKHFVEVYNMLGGLSAWISAGYSVVTPTFVADITNNNIVKVYPNPVTDVSTMEINGFSNGNSHVEFYNILGKTIKTIDIDFTKNIKIKNSDFPTGIYMYRLICGSNISKIGKIEIVN